jgi:type II secretory pathway component PulJ
MKNERMKKWIASAVFGLLGLVVIGYSIKLAYDVMAILFPNDPVLKFMAIALYDGGVIGWLLAYIAKAKGTPQRGISLLMTVLDFIGVAAMAIAGIYLGGQTLADVPEWVGGLVVVATIIATVLNAGAYYFYHANDPDVIEAIQAQELEDTLNEEALDQARFQVERKARELGAIMANRVTARMKYRLRLPMTEQEHSEWSNEVVDVQAYEATTAALPPPPVQNETFWSAVKSFFGGKRSRPQSGGMPLKNSTSSQQAMENIAQTNDALMAWETMTSGKRDGWWCKICRDEGKEWLWTTCDHILNAQGQIEIPRQQAMATMQEYMDKDGQWTEVPQESEPPTMDRTSYHPVSMGPKPPQT